MAHAAAALRFRDFCGDPGRLARSGSGVWFSSLRGTGGGVRPRRAAVGASASSFSGPIGLSSPAGPACPGLPWARAARKASFPGVGACHSRRDFFRLLDSYPPLRGGAFRPWRLVEPRGDWHSSGVGFCCCDGTNVVTRSRDSHICNCLASSPRK